MNTFWQAAGALFTALAALGANPAAAQSRTNLSQAAADERLVRILSAVAAQPITASPFFERRVSSLYAIPMESSGTLSFNPSGVIEKLTTRPNRERVIISADSISIDGAAGTPAKVIKIEAQSGLASYGLGLRAILSGNEKQLRQAFDIDVSGSFENWKVQLFPRDAALKRGVRQISVSGSKATLRMIETFETSGDTLELTIVPR